MMFREMRRKDRIKTYEENVQILEECTNGVLSVIGDCGYPYGVPVSYVYNDSKIYFHCLLLPIKVRSVSELRLFWRVTINRRRWNSSLRSILKIS